MSRSEVLAVADGSIFTGRQALENKLVDGLGGEAEAIAWLATKGVDPDLDVVEWKPTDQGGLLGAFSSSDIAARLFGIDSLAAEIARELGAERMFLDGLLSVWQPDPSAFGD